MIKSGKRMFHKWVKEETRIKFQRLAPDSSLT